MGDPHGGWLFIKTTEPNKAVRMADGEVIIWKDDAMVYKVTDGS